MGIICKHLNLDHCVECFSENRALDVHAVENLLRTSKTPYTHVGIIHSETSSGALNDVKQIGHLIKKYFPRSTFIVDSMCCFGGIDVNVKDCKIDFLVSSSNKCLQSVPGISFVICNKQKLINSKSQSLSLDLIDQHEFYDKCKLFRFTPPTHVCLAFEQALIELELEGGPTGRYKRIEENHRIVREKMLEMGFREFVPLSEQSKIINCFHHPTVKNFSYERFHYLLREKGKVIYSKSLTTQPTFRIGNIGNLKASDMYDLLSSIKEALNEMNVAIPLKE